LDLLFVFDWGEVAQGAVESLAVVEDFDELDDGPADLENSGPRLAVDQLFFEVANQLSLTALNRPGKPGDSIPWKRGWSHGEQAHHEAVPA
jgi:hypothetical protein